MKQMEAPKHWSRCQFGEACRFTTKPKGTRLANTGLIPFVPMEAVPPGGVFFGGYQLRECDQVASGTYFEPGDVLLAKITPSFENGKQGIIEHLPTPYGIATTEVIPFKAIDGKSDRLFLFFYLLRPEVRLALAQKMDGSTGRQRLAKSTLAGWMVSLPPLPEQEAIARALRAVQEAKQARERELELERERKAALMEHLFTHGTRNEPTKMTEIGEMPESWEVVTLCSLIRRASQRDPKRQPGETFRYVDVSGVCRDRLCIASWTTMTGGNAPSRARKIIENGDTIFATVRPTLRRVAFVPPALDNQICSTAFCVIRSNPKFLNARFAYHVVTRGEFVNRVSARQAGSSYPAVTDHDVLNQPIALPDLGEQSSVAAILDACDAKAAALRQERLALEELFGAMLEELMTGRLSAVPLIEPGES